MNKIAIKDFKYIGILLIGIWSLFIVSIILPINSLGIYPRSVFGLIGIPLSPFLHTNWSHITSNSLALLVFAPLFTLIEGRNAIQKVVILILLSGTLTWMIGRPAIHIGASGLIFSLYGYLISLGYFKRKPALILMSILISVFYGYMIFGILPGKSHISWEGHLAGFVAGIILARVDK